ncbi:MAG: LysM peptidoglycan-binding domain-containing protein [Roseibacillus sp.]
MNALPKLLQLALLPLLAASLQAASTYKVQSGDTLSSIARKNGTTSSQLMRDNGISNPNLLKIGQVLKVSSSSAKPTTSSKPKAKSTPSKTTGNYSVKAGETLYSIARKHGLSVSQLTSLNPGLNPSQLSVGQKIQTKGAVNSKPKATPKPKTVAKPKATPKPKAAKPMPVIAKTTPPAAKPKTEAAAKPTPAPLSTPVSEPKAKPNLIAEKKTEVPSAISSVMVSKEISFGALASRHRTSTKQLNELNGWSLKPTTILAKGSEIYVPGI